MADRLSELRDGWIAVRPRYVAFADAVRVLLAQLLPTIGVDVENIEARAKDVDSFVKKCRDHENYRSLDDLPDLCGARVIVYHLTDIVAVEALLSREFEVLERVLHGADDPTAFGYQSLHLVVRMRPARTQLLEYAVFRDLVVEIQVRTVLQHSWAAISHKLAYKSEADVPRSSRRKLSRVAALLETADELFQDFRNEIEALRRSYGAQASSGDDWAALPPDLDSFAIAWDHFPFAAVGDVAVRMGWLEVDVPNDDYRGTPAVTRLLRLLAAAEIETLGDFVRLLEDIANSPDDLALVASKSVEHGFRPYAVEPDIASIMIMLRYPWAAYRVGFADFASPIISAVEEIARQRGYTGPDLPRDDPSLFEPDDDYEEFDPFDETADYEPDATDYEDFDLNEYDL